MTIPGSLLFEMVLDKMHGVSLGATICVERRSAIIDGGRFAGPALSGTVEPGGTDWIVVRADGVRDLDVKLTLRTVEGELFAMFYQGYRTGSPEVLARAAAGEHVDPAAFDYRTIHRFEASGRLSWLNAVVAAGIGKRNAEGLVYQIYQIG
jgi:hypothetical protein